MQKRITELFNDPDTLAVIKRLAKSTGQSREMVAAGMVYDQYILKTATPVKSDGVVPNKIQYVDKVSSIVKAQSIKVVKNVLNNELPIHLTQSSKTPVPQSVHKGMALQDTTANVFVTKADSLKGASNTRRYTKLAELSDTMKNLCSAQASLSLSLKNGDFVTDTIKTAQAVNKLATIKMEIRKVEIKRAELLSVDKKPKKDKKRTNRILSRKKKITPNHSDSGKARPKLTLKTNNEKSVVTRATNPEPETNLSWTGRTAKVSIGKVSNQANIKRKTQIKAVKSGKCKTNEEIVIDVTNNLPMDKGENQKHLTNWEIKQANAEDSQRNIDLARVQGQADKTSTKKVGGSGNKGGVLSNKQDRLLIGTQLDKKMSDKYSHLVNKSTKLSKK